MKNIIDNELKYSILKPAAKSKNKAIIFYHGWGTNVESNQDIGELLANEGYQVVYPELIYHDTRNCLENHFDDKVIQNYFWKTVMESIDEWDELINTLGVTEHEIILVGSSMGGFIVNGIFATRKSLGGLININGSGSFVLSEQVFRKMGNRHELTVDEMNLLKEYDPVQSDNCSSPVLLMHGDSDTTVHIDGQKDYYTYLTRHKKRDNVDLMIYENINHVISPEMVRDMMEWLRAD
ncbi:alpha/beta hydrolase family protein [Chengkuizengella axinellae]|uniref:Prolyl oligopeptidase family serine peptidase n=1 Tax=Chengkuizengella axinellae TaxID=3064388 RepID=A0ABT9IZY5_9BACL|nr:prolyl oligopeptidase family serine peptidase [Chengkuizengella sp. 2205SS18-9]MDP5274928.1 prolyl oligopeptidase family serine peptidase [Chengkuizengella sp. 2205SS18-9]